VADDPQPDGAHFDAGQLDAEDAKLVTLARSARARNGVIEGAAVRDDTGRTYVASTVSLATLNLSALQAAVAMAVASGARALESAAVVTSSESIAEADRAVVADLTVDAPIFLADPAGTVLARYAASPAASSVKQLRVVVTAADYDDALRFYRDVLGLPQEAAFESPDGRVSILAAGRATLEITDPSHAAYIDEVEVGRRVAGPIRLAFEVTDSRVTTAELVEAGAVLVAEPTRTPWDSLNSRLDAPGATHVTIFTELG
jgi:catechol 2,3-dioxygenase-like lactoylglutathione lyase family enzyme